MVIALPVFELGFTSCILAVRNHALHKVTKKAFSFSGSLEEDSGVWWEFHKIRDLWTLPNCGRTTQTPQNPEILPSDNPLQLGTKPN